jgi:Heterokaryon incompatibility protein (HET)
VLKDPADHSAENPATEYIKGLLIDRDSSSSDAMKLVRYWTARCQKNHPGCISTGDFTLPTYLIDLEGSLRVIQTSSNQDDRKYITLSYVWGVAAQPVMMTKATKASLMDSIAEASLPQTHRDAIQVTRWLGVRYLWIDALCIIQDDNKEDKMKEIARMDRIFGNSFLTIQATRAESTYEGFLGPVKTPDVAPEIPYPLVRAPDRVFLRTKHMATTYGPGDARAWCYEERVLPRRVLIYGDKTLEFRCVECRYDDYGRVSDFTTQGPSSFWQPKPWYENSPVPKAARHPDPILDMLNLWYWMLDLNYTPRLLTKSGDRLLAVGGIVRQLLECIPGPYIAGLWQVDLPWGLLWQCRRGIRNQILGSDVLKATGYLDKPTKMSMTRPKDKQQQRAPSWSWAALDGGTNHPSILQRYAPGSRQFTSSIKRRVFAKFERLPRTLGDESEMRGLGELEEDASLHVSAPLFTMAIVYRDDERWKGFDQQIGRGNWRSFPYMIPYSAEGNTNIETKWKDVPIGAVQLDLSTEEERLDSIWCLLMVEGIGLALDCVDEEKNIFIRKGVFITTSLWPTEFNEVDPTSVCII